MLNHYYIGKVKVSVTDINAAIDNVVSSAPGQPKYVCVANVRTTVLGNRDEVYRRAVNNAFMNLPDGMPIVWAGRLSGAKEIRRTTGPDLFTELLRSKYRLKHYILGDTDEVISALIKKIGLDQPQTIISGFYSPPFTSIENFNIEEIAGRINMTDSDIIWVALGSPKQDFFSEMLVKHLNRGIVIGVGAAFRFYLGEFRHPPLLFRKLGLEGVFWRFFKNPVTELKWYIHHIPAYIGLLTRLRYKH
ncbi:MAG TPA: WecB/TagA/CpsF family glycosyltransferase [Bacteroidales bacterium]|nr:WecB/TagA/CpsF family glycosyltransferase [Bacteroidales bacterium]